MKTESKIDATFKDNVIIDLRSNSIADIYGLQKGDKLIKVNNTYVQTIQQIKLIQRSAAEKKDPMISYTFRKNK